MAIADMTAIALVWFYIVTFLILTAHTSHRNGRSVWLFRKGNENQGLPAFLFRAAFVLAAAYPPFSIWLDSASKADHPTGLVDQAIHLIGLPPMVVGAVLSLYAQKYMGSSWRIGAASGQLGRIVDTGPFGISRNPVFVGQILLFIGLLFVFPTVFQCLITASLLVAIGLQVRIEERVLADEMGDDYREYMNKVRRWL